MIPALPQRYDFRKGRPNFQVCPGYDGRLVLDIFHHMRERHTGLKGEGAYKLNGVSSQFLGEKKEDIDYKQIPKLQNGDSDSRRDLAIYCLKVSIPLFFLSLVGSDKTSLEGCLSSPTFV